LANQSRRLLQRSQDPEQNAAVLDALAEDLREAFQQKTRGLTLTVVDGKDRAISDNATLYFCGAALHLDLAVAEDEFNLAGRALAFGLSTASVSHAMRSVEASLHTLCRTLGITFPGTVELQDWKNLTDKIKSEIDGLDQRQPRSPQKTAQLKMLSELMLPADGFRLAWRNHVAHAREKYEEPEARKILGYVGDYLKRLSAAMSSGESKT
jgi:phage-related baseplate assembly protein